MILQSVENNLLKHFHNLDISFKKSSLLLAYSGGIDSSILLDVLVKLKNKYQLKLYLCHINHNYSSNSFDMEDFAKTMSSKHNISFIRSDFVWNKKGNFESLARTYRYSFFYESLIKYNIDFILTAHHLDDHLETIEMRLSKSNEWSQLLGIRRSMDKIVRPMLDVRKSDIVNYAKNNRVNFIVDNSNSDISIMRNKIRLLILPQKKAKDGNYETKLIKYNKQAIAKLSKLKEKIYDDSLIYIQKKNLISINKIKFKSYDYEERKLVIQITVLKSFGQFVTKTKNEWVNIMKFATSDYRVNKFYFIGDNIRLSRGNNFFHLDRFHAISNKTERLKNNSNLKWCNYLITTELVNHFNIKTIENQMIFPISLFNKGLFVRSWNFGDRIKIDSCKSKKISDIFIDNKSSMLSKYLTPIICDQDDNVLWVVGYRKKNSNIKDDSAYVMISYVKEYLYE